MASLFGPSPEDLQRAYLKQVLASSRSAPNVSARAGASLGGLLAGGITKALGGPAGTDRAKKIQELIGGVEPSTDLKQYYRNLSNQFSKAGFNTEATKALQAAMQADEKQTKVELDKSKIALNKAKTEAERNAKKFGGVDFKSLPELTKQLYLLNSLSEEDNPLAYQMTMNRIRKIATNPKDVQDILVPIFDKIKASGYKSLGDFEKETLNNIQKVFGGQAILRDIGSDLSQDIPGLSDTGTGVDIDLTR